MKTAKSAKKTRAQLERRILELEAGSLIAHKHAKMDIVKASVDVRTGSGVVLTITALGGAEIIPPVMIRDGLSNAAIQALCADIQRSSDEAQNVIYALPRSA